MKHARPHNSLKCPCCGQMRGPAEQQVFIRQIETEVPDLTYVTLSGIRIGNYYLTKAKSGGIDWACDECLHARRAIQGQPTKQLFRHFAPHFAYFDKPGICCDCGVEFTFFKAAQLHWYEHLRLWVQAEKVRCDACQQLKKRRDRFSQLIAANDYTDAETLREIIAYYLERKEYVKAKQFLAIGKNKYAENTAAFSRLNSLLNNVRQIEKNEQE